MIEAAEGIQALVKRAFAGVSERRMAKVMRKSKRLGEVLVEAKRTRQRARHLRHLERVCQPGAVVVALVKHEHLRLMLKPSEGGGVDDAVAIAAERAAAFARELRMKPATAPFRVASIGRARRCGIDRHRRVPPSAIDLGLGRT